MKRDASASRCSSIRDTIYWCYEHAIASSAEQKIVLNCSCFKKSPLLKRQLLPPHKNKRPVPLKRIYQFKFQPWQNLVQKQKKRIVRVAQALKILFARSKQNLARDRL